MTGTVESCYECYGRTLCENIGVKLLIISTYIYDKDAYRKFTLNNLQNPRWEWVMDNGNRLIHCRDDPSCFMLHSAFIIFLCIYMFRFVMIVCSWKLLLDVLISCWWAVMKSSSGYYEKSSGYCGTSSGYYDISSGYYENHLDTMTYHLYIMKYHLYTMKY